MTYLDHNATTPVLSDVREAMLRYLGDEWGNPSSTYRFGSRLKSKIEDAREQVADLIGCTTPREIIFTSGGTESNNTAIHAGTLSCPEKRHIITSQVEHSSALTYCRFLEKHHGYRVTCLPVDREGLLSMTDLENALIDDTAIVSLMWANNETGVLFPVEQIAQLCRSRGVLYHCDAVQSAGKLPITSPSPDTNSARRKASARSMCKRKRPSSPSCTAAIKSAPDAVARRMSPASSASALLPLTL